MCKNTNKKNNNKLTWQLLLSVKLCAKVLAYQFWEIEDVRDGRTYFSSAGEVHQGGGVRGHAAAVTAVTADTDDTDPQTHSRCRIKQ